MTDEGSGHLTLEAMRMEILVQSMDPGGLGEKKAMSSLPYWSLNNVIMTILWQLIFPCQHILDHHDHNHNHHHTFVCPSFGTIADLQTLQ